MEEKQEEINIAKVERMLERNKELEEIILKVRELVDSNESDDFILSKINAITFEWS